MARDHKSFSFRTHDHWRSSRHFKTSLAAMLSRTCFALAPRCLRHMQTPMNDLFRIDLCDRGRPRLLVGTDATQKELRYFLPRMYLNVSLSQNCLCYGMQVSSCLLLYATVLPSNSLSGHTKKSSPEIHEARAQAFPFCLLWYGQYIV